MDRLSFVALHSILEETLSREQLNNELANLSTIGFKRTFANVSKGTKITGPGFDSRVEPTNLRNERVSLVPGIRMVSGNPLDIAMNDSTVLGVTASNGELAFTRRGDMRVNSAGQLQLATGEAVRGQNGVVNVPTGYVIEIAGDGSVYANTLDTSKPAAPVLLGRLLLRDASEATLKRRADGLLTPEGNKDADGGDIQNGKIVPSIISGALEGSSVSAIDSMVRLLDFTRNFEMRMKLIKEANNLDTTGASMIKSA